MTMTHVFLDTSALIKLYLTKVGSVWLQNYLAEKLSVISQLALFEATTVLRRRYADGEFSEDVALAYLARIISDTKKYKRVPLGGEPQLNRLAAIAFNLNGALRLRALDGLQLVAAGIALEAANALTPPEPLIFVSAENQLLIVAQSLGFSLENPEDHL